MISRERTGTVARGCFLAMLTMSAVAVSEPASVMAAPALVQGNDSAQRDAALKKALFQMRDAIDRYYAQRGHYPAQLKTLETEGYLRIPKDPFTNRTDSWRALPAKPGRDGRSAGIYDVKNRSSRTSPDGTRYSDW